MKIETKYDLGDVVWYLSRRKTAKQTDCSTCKASGRVYFMEIQDSTCACPDCGGCGYCLETPEVVISLKAGTIGQIRTKYTKEQGDSDVGTAEHVYMLEERGIGSGSLWEEKLLYPDIEAALVAAQAEIAKESSDNAVE